MLYQLYVYIIYYLVFQKNERRTSTVFDISYYKVFKKYLLFLGQFPKQSRWSSKFNVTVMTGSLLTFYFPAVSKNATDELNTLTIYVIKKIL